jgi:hypothetical protein
LRGEILSLNRDWVKGNLELESKSKLARRDVPVSLPQRAACELSETDEGFDYRKTLIHATKIRLYHVGTKHPSSTPNLRFGIYWVALPLLPPAYIPKRETRQRSVTDISKSAFRSEFVCNESDKRPLSALPAHFLLEKISQAGIAYLHQAQQFPGLPSRKKTGR